MGNNNGVFYQDDIMLAKGIFLNIKSLKLSNMENYNFPIWKVKRIIIFLNMDCWDRNYE